MAFWCYILRCADGRYCTGHTDNLERRTAEHDSGDHCEFTHKRRPVSLVWSEYFSTRLEALEAERQVGGWSRAKKAALIRGDWQGVSLFARPPGERFSTSLETNGGVGDTSENLQNNPRPFVSSDVEKPQHHTMPSKAGT